VIIGVGSARSEQEAQARRLVQPEGAIEQERDSFCVPHAHQVPLLRDFDRLWIESDGVRLQHAQRQRDDGLGRSNAESFIGRGAADDADGAFPPLYLPHAAPKTNRRSRARRLSGEMTGQRIVARPNMEETIALHAVLRPLLAHQRDGADDAAIRGIEPFHIGGRALGFPCLDLCRAQEALECDVRRRLLLEPRLHLLQDGECVASGFVAKFQAPAVEAIRVALQFVVGQLRSA
jgi:hypothetical protein